MDWNCLRKLLPLLSSDQPGEVAAAAGAVARQLSKAGLNWHDFTDRVCNGANGHSSFAGAYDLKAANQRAADAQREMRQCRSAMLRAMERASEAEETATSLAYKLAEAERARDRILTRYNETRAELAALKAGVAPSPKTAGRPREVRRLKPVESAEPLTFAFLKHALLHIREHHNLKLTPWERDFLHTVLLKLEYRTSGPTAKQLSVINKLLARFNLRVSDDAIPF